MTEQELLNEFLGSKEHAIHSTVMDEDLTMLPKVENSYIRYTKSFYPTLKSTRIFRTLNLHSVAIQNYDAMDPAKKFQFNINLISSALNIPIFKYTRLCNIYSWTVASSTRRIFINSWSDMALFDNVTLFLCDKLNLANLMDAFSRHRKVKSINYETAIEQAKFKEAALFQIVNLDSAI